MTHQRPYLARLVAAILGRDTMAGLPTDVVELRSRVATLEMDRTERDQRIAKMKQEYEQVQLARERATENAGSEELEQFFTKAAAPLSNLAALAAAAKEGHAVEVNDVLQLAGSLAKVFARAGLEQIGAPGEQASYNANLHQRMSGGSVASGKAVKLCVPGYRLGNKVLLKAMVTSREDD